MKVLALILLGALGGLALLRGIELLLVVHNIAQAVVELALALVFFVFFRKVWAGRKAQST
jgi:hypothetical protein